MKAFDVSKFRKSITKSIDGLSIGFNDPTDWIDTGNYCLNYLISGDFKKGVPLGRVSMFAGSSGSGKSLLCSGSIASNAQKQGIYTILIDTEQALDKKWLEALGVDTSEEKMLRLNMSMIDDVAKVITDFVKEYKLLPEEERPKVLFVVDSLGMLLTPTDKAQFASGDLKGDMGRKAKALYALIKNCVDMFGNLNIGMITTNHTYESQNMFSPDAVISGGIGFQFASSIIVAMEKRKLKEDEEGNKTTEVNGIRAACKVMKTRYNKPFESMEIKIPYTTGMDPYSGLFDFFLSQAILTKEGNSYIYVDSNTGEMIKKFKKKWEANDENCLDIVMNNIQNDEDKSDKE